jgi:hypothetical protein
MGGISESSGEEKCIERITFRTVTLNPILYVIQIDDWEYQIRRRQNSS